MYVVLVRELYEALKSGRVNRVDDILVYSIIRMFNLDVKPDVKIKFVKHGSEVDLKEYLE
ncbi:MAG: hypothetical protein ACO2OR_00755 [Desulfurococcaceae archaeon]